VTPEIHQSNTKHRFPASAIPIAFHGRTPNRFLLFLFKQINDPDTPGPRNENAARVCHR
jgi:hypothetical protein